MPKAHISVVVKLWRRVRVRRSNPTTTPSQTIITDLELRARVNMLFPFTLPTTSAISYPTYFESPTYPSLPLLTSSHRGAVCNALKAHKRLSPAAQGANIPSLIKELELYISHLLALFWALSDNEAFSKEGAPKLATSWRAVLSSKKLTSNEPPRVLRPGLSYEIFWSLSTLAYAYTLLARSQMQQILSPPATSASPRASASTPAANVFNQASTNLLTSASIFTYLLSLAEPPHASTWPPDISPQVLSALSSLSISAATLTAVVKQDPYPTYLALATVDAAKKKSKKGANTDPSKEWLYNPPDPPSGVRALLLARLCVAASDHATKALGLLSTTSTSSSSSPAGGALTNDVVRYADSLQKVSRAKACRFLGIDAEASGRVGEAISWIRAAKDQLAAPASARGSSSFRSGEKKDVWGLDAGKRDEGRTLDALGQRWEKLNDTVMFHTCPEARDLLAKIPSGREIHSVKTWEPPKLVGDDLRALRAEREEGGEELFGGEEDSGGEEVDSRADGAEYAWKGGYY